MTGGRNCCNVQSIDNIRTMRYVMWCNVIGWFLYSSKFCRHLSRTISNWYYIYYLGWTRERRRKKLINMVQWIICTENSTIPLHWYTEQTYFDIHVDRIHFQVEFRFHVDFLLKFWLKWYFCFGGTFTVRRSERR